MIPTWFNGLAIAYLVLGGLSALYVLVDVTRRPQSMWIMNLVWPITALFGTLAIVALYRAEAQPGAGHAGGHGHGGGHGHQGGHDDDGGLTAALVAKATLHCGAGCTLGDIVAEWLAFLVPAVAVAFGWHWLFADKLFAVWVLDYLFAYGFGIAFQYFTIKPMRDLTVVEGLLAAVRADTFSLTAWQVGMYGTVAIAKFWLFDRVFAAPLVTDSVAFWFVMQVAMMAGFLTSAPINVWLLSIGWKEKM